MRVRVLFLTAPVALGFILLASAECGTPIQVVDSGGAPVPGALIQHVPSSSNGSVTDQDGKARLRDAWNCRPWFSRVGGWLCVLKDGKTWWFIYPPPAVIRLDPSEAYPRASPASQQGAAADAPKAARR